MTDAAIIAPLRTLATRIVELADIDAAAALLFMQGNTPQEVADKLAGTFASGGPCDKLAAQLDDARAAKEYAAGIAAAFAPFAPTLKAILPGAGERYTRTTRGYKRTTAAEIAEKREAKARRVARFVATYEEAAERLNVKRRVVPQYVKEGKLVGVYRDGQRRAYGVTRQSLETYAKKQELRRAAVIEKAAAEEAERKERTENGGIFYAQDGRKVYGAERVSGEEACATFGRTKSRMAAWANAGKIERVYADAKRRHAVGYLRASVEACAAERAAIAAGGGVYYTRGGKIVGAERVSRKEAAELMGVRELSVTGICRRGDIERVYADAERTIACGFTRASVEAWAAANPRHIPAKRAQAVPNFMIEPLPPQPRPSRLRAARLEPVEEDAAAETTPPEETETAERPKRRERPRIVFRLAAWHGAQSPDNQLERNQDMDEPQDKEATEAAKPGEKRAKLEVAKAYTVHEGGVIRAICVSEADRDEIVAALALYRRTKAAPGEIESALALYRAAREMIGKSSDGESEVLGAAEN